jgi:hypothetical protein
MKWMLSWNKKKWVAYSLANFLFILFTKAEDINLKLERKTTRMWKRLREPEKNERFILGLNQNQSAEFNINLKVYNRRTKSVWDIMSKQI